MRQTKRLVLGACALVLTSLAASSAQASDSATGILKHCMSRYSAMNSFAAQCDWKELSQTSHRTIQYTKPNCFKVVNTMPGDFVQTSVCDGKHLAEYSNQAGLGAQVYAAPVSIASATSMQMQHFMFCGSLLYKFFGGSGNVQALVKKGPVQLGKPVKVQGVACQTVRFQATGFYGNTEIAIGTADGLVHQISYDSAPLIEMMKQQGTLVPSLKTTETFHDLQIGKPIASRVFSTQLPAGTKSTDMTALSGGNETKPPVPLGSAAPDFTVTQLSDSKSVTLSSLRGQVVMLDFWATWCPPCRKSLPETQAIAAQYGGKGLAVMTISNEDVPTITQFNTKNHYTFPAYRDASNSAGEAFQVNAIPTLVVIDKDGKLVAYLVGLQTREDVLAALKKAGLVL